LPDLQSFSSNVGGLGFLCYFNPKTLRRTEPLLMFFFIAGIQPKQIVLEETSRPCPACGLFQTRLVRQDYYLSLFFLPLFRVKKGATVLECRRCGAQSASDSAGGFEFSGRADYNKVCPACGKTPEPSFRFCPYCGQDLKQ
jgi:endogenous inhibitor of DNA gyrase (YacG/DUF329 family)